MLLKSPGFRSRGCAGFRPGNRGQRRSSASPTPCCSEQPLSNLKTLERVVRDQLVGIAYVAVLMAVFGALALVLAAIGVYSVMAYAVVERTHEIGVRMALGAAQRDVLWLMVRRGLLPAASGAAVGLVLAFGMARLLANLIYGVSSFDVGAFGSVVMVLIAAALLACWAPARRATRTDPVVALRHE